MPQPETRLELREDAMAGWIGRGVSTLLVAALAFMLLGPAARAQTFPSRPVRILVPFPPGGAVDIVARSLADELGKRWGSSILIENRPGTGGGLAPGAAAAHGR